MRRLIQTSVSVGILALFVLGATCEPVLPPNAEIVGEEGDSVLYSGPYEPVNGPPPVLPLYRVNLADGTREQLTDGIGLGALSDGEYVAWSDGEARVIRAENLTTGDLAEYLVDVGREDYYSPGVYDIDAARMFVTYSENELQDQFRLIDLASGGERDLQLLDPLDLFDMLYSADLDDGHLAYFANPLDDTEPLALELAVRLEVLDLATDERTVIDRGMRVGEGPFVADGLVVWSQFKPGSMKSQIKAYDLDKKEKSTLIQNLDSAGETAWLKDFDGTYLLVLRQPTLEIGGILELPRADSTLELIPLDGGSRVIASARATLLDTEFDQARLVDHYVIWPEYETSELAVYDVETGFTRRYSLFAD